MSDMQPVHPMEVAVGGTADQVVLDLVAVTSAVTGTSGEVAVVEDMVAAAVDMVVEVMAAVDMVAAVILE